MVSLGPGRLDVLLRGNDNKLYHKAWDGKSWAPEISLGFARVGEHNWTEEPANIARKGNTISTFDVGTDGQLYHIPYENGSWKPCESLGGRCRSGPCAIKLSDDRFDVFVLGLNGNLFHKWFDGQFKPAGDYENLGGISIKVPEACSWGPSQMNVFVLGADNAIWHKSWNGKAYSPSPTGFERLGGNFYEPPVAVCWGPNRIDLFATGINSQLQHKWWDGSKWLPSIAGFETLGGEYLIGRPHVVSWGLGRLDVFGIGPDRSLLHKYFDGSAWSGYKNLGGVCMRIDKVICPTRERIDVFYRGVDGSSFHKWFTEGSWKPSADEAESLGPVQDLSVGSLIPVTGAIDYDSSTRVQPRIEINDLHAYHKEQFDLYLRALYHLQMKPEKESMSYYGISSIHGVPYIRWPFDEKPQPQDITAGYCCHRSVLFPSWHRAYLLLLEQAIQEEALAIAKEFTGTYRPIYIEAATKLRLPFWDWGSNRSGLPRAVLYDVVAVAHGGPGGTIVYKKIPNPLLKYRFRDQEMHRKYFVNGQAFDADQPDQIWSQYLETMRCPDQDGITQHDVVDSQMYKQNPSLRQSIYKLMTVNEYQPFASTGYEPGTVNVNNSQSVEGIHDQIHIFTGVDPTPLDGHMGDPMYAAFDPIFWLHHANVDRVYSLWQVLHPGVEVQPQPAKDNTMKYPLGTVQDSNTPLYPFRHRDGKHFTSKDVDKWDSITKWGYRYPDMPAEWFDEQDQKKLMKHVSQRVIDLYGPEPKAYPNVPRKAVEEANKMNQLAKESKDGTNYLKNGYQIIPGYYPTFNLEAIHRREWLVNIRIENFAVDGSFFIHVFLGDFNENPESWMQDLSLVGSHAIFSSAIGQTGCQKCIQDKQINAIVSGNVPLTAKLLEKDLPDLEPATVAPYLRKNLHWRVQAANGTPSPSQELDSLVVSISCTIVESPEDPAALPIWGVPQVIESITEGRPGGFDLDKYL